MKKILVKTVKNIFRIRFKTEPLMVFSPGRINLIGEHTDYNEGFVFPAAINKGIVLGIQKTNLGISQIYALDKDEMYEFNISDLKPLKHGGWKNYILGVIFEIQKRGFKISPFNLAFAGNIPSGAGLSSSAALENSVVFGINALFDLGISKEEMILISQSAEHQFVGVKCGIMDQYASMFGIKKSALFLDCRTLEARPYIVNFKDYDIILINTNVKHNLSESAYNERRIVCEEVSDTLNIKTLRDASKEDLKGIKETITLDKYTKALYIIEENQRVESFREMIQTDNLEILGKLLYASHEGLTSQYKVSCTELDFLVDSTKKNSAVLGSRMMGGGFGGCTLNLVHKDHVIQFKKTITNTFQKQFGTQCSIYKVTLSDGTNII